MTDTLLDDVKALLDKDFGDDRILKQIFRACENNEVVSNYERNYVRKLSEKHLGKKPEFNPTSIEEKPVIVDAVIPQTQSIPQYQSLQTTPEISYSKPRNKKIMFGIGGLALIIIIATVISFSGVTSEYIVRLFFKEIGILVGIGALIASPSYFIIHSN